MKRKASAAQLRNLAKGRKKLAAMRRAGTVTRKKRPTRRARPRRKNPDISDEAYELILYAENTEALYNQQQSIVKNLIRKMNRGVYDHSKAPTLWKYWMDSAAKGYTREHGTGGGYGIFTPTIRREAATYMAQQEFDSINAGDYEDLMPLKKKNPHRRKVVRKKRVTKSNPAYTAGKARGVYSTIRLAAPNDANGNPRRLFLSLKGGEPVGVFEEGYTGVAAITDGKMRLGYQGITIAVTATDYKEWLKVYRDPKYNKGVKHNPAYGNFQTARNVLKTGRTANPKSPTRHWVVASKSGSRVQWWTGKEWSNSYQKAAEFSDKKNAAYAARNHCKRRCAIVLYGTQDATVADALR